jgi:uncharacterized membrane protein YedE/YeeE
MVRRQCRSRMRNRQQQQQQQRVGLITSLARMVAVLGCTVSVYPARFLPLVLGRRVKGVGLFGSGFATGLIDCSMG